MGPWVARDVLCHVIHSLNWVAYTCRELYTTIHKYDQDKSTYWLRWKSWRVALREIDPRHNFTWRRLWMTRSVIYSNDHIRHMSRTKPFHTVAQNDPTLKRYDRGIANSQRNFTWGGTDESITSFADYSQTCVSSAAKRNAQQLTEAHNMRGLFSVCSLRYERDNKQNLHENWNMQTLF